MSLQDTDRIAFAEFELDTAHRKLSREGQSVALYAKTFDLLEFLVGNNGKIVSKDEILEKVWAGQFVEESNLSVQISTLRKALGEKPDEPRFLVTIPGKGYKFVADVRRSPDELVEKRLIENEGSDTEGRLGVKTSHLRTPYLIAAASILAVLIGVAGYVYISQVRTSKIESIAVLPFVNKGSDSTMEYLSEGLAESVIQSLSGNPDLRVMSRSSSFHYKGSANDVKKIGRDLNVQAILTGHVELQADNLSVSTELISTEDNSVIWGDSFTRRMSDLEKLQTDIAGAISQKLKVKLSGSQESRGNHRQPVDPEAYRLYLMGRYHLNRLADDGFRKAGEYFQQAIDRQPDYARAYAGLAESHHRLSGYNAVSPHEGFPKAREAALKPLEIDYSLAEAHTALGAVRFFYDWDWAAAENEFLKAIELDPNSGDAHQMYGYFLAATGRLDEAMTEVRRAHELDPLSIEKLAAIGETYYLQRDYDRAIEHFHKALEMDPNSGFAHWAIGRALLEKGQNADAIASFERSIPLSGDSPDELVELARAYARVGKRDQASKIANDLTHLSDRRYVSPVTIGSIHAALGEKSQAFDWFERAVRERDFLLVLLKVDPMFDDVRSDPRFMGIINRVGLDK